MIYAQSTDSAKYHLEEIMEEMKVPGMSLTIIKNGSRVYGAGLGYSEGKTPVTKHTLFQAASLSKFPTALLYMINHQSGYINLDHDINRYLDDHHLSPHSKNPGIIPSISQLLSHTAGTNISGFLGYKRTRRRVPSIELVIEGKHTFIWEPKIKITSPVNHRYRYSGGGYSYLQKAIMDVKNEDFSDIMRSELFEPIGIKSSFYGLIPPESSAIATAHNKKGRAINGKYRLYPQEAAAGLWTTAEEYAYLLQEVLRAFKGKDTKVLSKDSADLIVQPTYTTDGQVNSYGLGVMLLLDDEKRAYAIQHSGRNVGHSSFFYLNLHSGDGFVILTNRHKTNFDVLNKVVSDLFQIEM